MESKFLKIERKESFEKFNKMERESSVPTEEILSLWSKKADELIEKALKEVSSGVTPLPRFCVIGLGKLGSMELNFSSDIDILFVYDGEFEAATRVASRLVKLLNDIDDDGFVFRVDLDLRPEGKLGPLVNTVDALERYYEIRGEEWERQMLVRARPVAGDLALGDEFIERIRPFVYRKTIGLSDLKKVRSIKMALERSSESENGINLKLGPGGIRELEFFIHTLQILNGGRIKELQTSSTFRAFELLAKNKIIQKNKCEKLKKSYIFLRKLENLIQGMEDRQTYLLPKNTKTLQQLTTWMGLSKSEDLLREVSLNMKLIQEAFSSLFETDYEKSEMIESFAANLETCKTYEEVVDSLPWFKSYAVKKLQSLDMESKISADEVSERLTFLAEIIIQKALELSLEKYKKMYGRPISEKRNEAGFAVVAMGRIGAMETDYGSDLDLVFIFDGEGSTEGEKSITNHEFFTKVAQGIISIITLPTRYGRAYSIDAELRPSGGQGTLITSLDAFNRYHKREAKIWEKQALMKARPVAGDITLSRKITALLNELIYDIPLPHNANAEIEELRTKIRNEKPEKEGFLDLKNCDGGLLMIESIVRYLQLKNGGANHKIRNQKLKEAIQSLGDEGIIKNHKQILDAYLLFKRVISRTRLFSSHASETIDTNAEYFGSVASSLGFNSKDDLLKAIKNAAVEIKTVYSANVFSLRS